MQVTERLAALVARLYKESEGYADNPADAQLWYNRGYANGVAAFLYARGEHGALKDIDMDNLEQYRNERIMAWHKAYHHGFSMGEREAGEVYPSGD